ncbi:MAG: ImmA/IrrE family metallo-endopeptidase [Bacteroidales bacterium]|nr:ImmA/IrrE family metallo-endopeptidase [Bacteroidales bacterium]
MIRYIYINNVVLRIYSMLSYIQFPISIKEVINLIPNCKYMSYQKFAQINNCTIEDVIQICESKSGCTHYDISQNRYLILCNQSNIKNNYARQRWTCAHEIGHIECKHHSFSAYDKLSENSLIKIKNPEFESEADYFAATLLAPLPLFDELNIKSPIDIQNVFGLSAEASLYRYKEYLSWKNSHRKTAWENDMIRIYKQKSVLYK